MTIETRIQKLEKSLAAREKCLLWLRRAKAAGGFGPFWEKELKGPLAPFDWFEDEEAYLLFRLVNDVNFSILNSASKNQDLRVFAHCALDGIVRRISRPDKSGGLVPVFPIPKLAARVGVFLVGKFKSLLEEAELMASAIDVISETYLGCEDILFPDTRAILDAEISHVRVTVDICKHLAEWLDLDPIAAEGIPPGHPTLDAKVKEIVNLSRAEALVGCSDLRKFKKALRRAFPECSELCAPLVHS